MDELCLRQSPALWLWSGVSRLTKQVVGFVVGDRTDAMLPIVWEDVPRDYRKKQVCTDGWEAYSQFFSAVQHTVCAKGSGKTSVVEGLNTKWRQRQSGLVRKSCGVCWAIEQDITERFLILVERHNQECARRWHKQRQKQHDKNKPKQR